MDLKLFVCVIGLVLMIEGLPYFAFPHRIKDWLRQLLTLPESTLRIVGFVSMSLGLLLIFWARR